MASIDDIRDLLKGALEALENPQKQGALRHAERLVDEADEALRELIDPPNPYTDMKLRPGLNQTQSQTPKEPPNG